MDDKQSQAFPQRENNTHKYEFTSTASCAEECAIGGKKQQQQPDFVRQLHDDCVQ